MERIKVSEDDNSEIQLTSTDPITGEGTDDLSLEISSDYCSAWVHLNEDVVKELRDHLSEWLNGNL